MSDTPAAEEFTVQETSEEPVLASVDYDEDDAAGGDDIGGDDLAAELEELQKIVSDTQAKTDALVAATKSAVSEGLAQTVGGPDDDARSVFVSEVDFSVTGEELAKHFQSCGQVAKVTLLKDKITMRPKGTAYIMFKDAESVANAIRLNGSEFKSRILKIVPKRTNLPAFMIGGGRGRGAPWQYRGGYGGGRGAFRGGYNSFRGGPRGRGARGGFRGRGRGF